jgi:hypothetical protein
MFTTGVSIMGCACSRLVARTSRALFLHGLSYAPGGAAVTILGTCGVVVASVISVASSFAALVFTPVRRGAALGDGTGGWAPDPSRRYELRYFDGAAWTRWVLIHGQPAHDANAGADGNADQPDVPAWFATAPITRR